MGFLLLCCSCPLGSGWGTRGLAYKIQLGQYLAAETQMALQHYYCYQNKPPLSCFPKNVSFAVFDSLAISEIVFCLKTVHTIEDLRHCFLYLQGPKFVQLIRASAVYLKDGS